MDIHDLGLIALAAPGLTTSVLTIIASDWVAPVSTILALVETASALAGDSVSTTSALASTASASAVSASTISALASIVSASDAAGLALDSNLAARGVGADGIPSGSGWARGPYLGMTRGGIGMDSMRSRPSITAPFTDGTWRASKKASVS